MASLSLDQLSFLKTQKISRRDVFDATGLRPKEYQAKMEASGQYFAYGVTPCNAGKHELRSKAGHCIQCDTARIAYMQRHYKGSTVYLAGSVNGKMMKIGSTSNLTKRVGELCKEQYGGVSDWEMLAWANAKTAGRVEFDAHERLKAYSTDGSYVRNGQRQNCYELFECNYLVAKTALVQSLPVATKLVTLNEARLIAVYNALFPATSKPQVSKST